MLARARLSLQFFFFSSRTAKLLFVYLLARNSNFRILDVTLANSLFRVNCVKTGEKKGTQIKSDVVYFLTPFLAPPPLWSEGLHDFVRVFCHY